VFRGRVLRVWVAVVGGLGLLEGVWVIEAVLKLTGRGSHNGDARRADPPSPDPRL
jgi:hypothetical protein